MLPDPRDLTIDCPLLLGDPSAWSPRGSTSLSMMSPVPGSRAPIHPLGAVGGRFGVDAGAARSMWRPLLLAHDHRAHEPSGRRTLLAGPIWGGRPAPAVPPQVTTCRLRGTKSRATKL